ncbi:response regulator transcription factor [Candidatus Pantoea multigeneris]|uniref:Response regulator transcription factor n=1 Tax=Candidatus Pantoea multigeneris TaxID=2608357 RepID=A0ABX0RFC7_9GAMM|nr:response regulator transcription factor [Pantoea multigeneris]NIF23757.1 response regulator transcription factor [Pantoea multigeneris]
MYNQNPKIKVAILDDHPIILRSFEVVAASSGDISIVGSFTHSRELLGWLKNNDCDVLILDYILHSDELDGLSLIKNILVRHPHTKILLSSSMESIAVIRTAFMLGIKGYIGKREETAIYLNAIRAIHNGQRYIPPAISAELAVVPVRKRDEAFMNGQDNPEHARDISELEKLLTPREAEVIHCYLEGMSIIDIAAKIKRSRKTVSGHKQTGMKKLGLSSDLELFKYRSDLFK